MVQVRVADVTVSTRAWLTRRVAVRAAMMLVVDVPMLVLLSVRNVLVTPGEMDPQAARHRRVG